MNIISLIEENSDILELILVNLTIYDIINLSLINSCMCNKLREYIQYLDRKCMAEIEYALDDMIENATFERNFFQLNNHKIRRRYVECSICPNKYHRLMTNYFRNSKDAVV